jgi:hypothetical protein
VGDDDGRGQEEHGAEQHLHQRIQVGDGRHCSSIDRELRPARWVVGRSPTSSSSWNPRMWE